MNGGWIKFYRKSIDSSIFKDPELWKLWCLCLLKANHKQCYEIPVGKTPVQLQPGQFITGRNSLLLEFYPPKQRKRKSAKTIWEWMHNLEKLENLSIQSFSKFSIITITNWDRYQNDNEQNVQENVQEGCRKGATDVQEGCTNKNDKNVKNVKNKEYCASDLAPEAQIGSNGDGYITHKKRKLTGKRLETFELFWESFGYKKGRAKAADSWIDIPELTESLVKKITEAAKKEAEERPGIVACGRTPIFAQGWLSGRRWEDETEGGQDDAFSRLRDKYKDAK